LVSNIYHLLGGYIYCNYIHSLNQFNNILTKEWLLGFIFNLRNLNLKRSLTRSKNKYLINTFIFLFPDQTKFKITGWRKEDDIFGCYISIKITNYYGPTVITKKIATALCAKGPKVGTCPREKSEIFQGRENICGEYFAIRK
jgi:hypothetical protein